MASILDQRRTRRRFNTAALMHQRAFKPFQQPTTAPMGSFDPTLAAGVRQSQRGLGDLQADTGLANTRAQDDLTRNLGEAGYNRDTSLSNLLRQGQTVDRNYGQATADRVRSYGNLAQSQQNRANAAGLVGVSGYDAQAQQNRQANETRDQQRADQAHSDYTAGYHANQQAIGHQYDQTVGGLNLGYQRGLEDRGSALSRATREAGLYGQDVNEAELFQAKNAGMLPTPPPGEVTRQGLTYSQLPGRQGAVLQSGRAISQSALTRMLRARGWRPRR